MRNFRKFRRGILRGQMDTRIAVNLCGSTRGTKKVWLFESRHEAKTTLRPLILITLLFTAVEEVSRGGAGERGGRGGDVSLARTAYSRHSSEDHAFSLQNIIGDFS